MRLGRLAFAVLLVAGACSDDEPAPSLDETVRMNEIQTLGSHNSYHQRIPDGLFAILEQFDADLARSLDYTQPPLTVQLVDRGARQLELDVFADPEGGLFATRHAWSLIDEPTEVDDPKLRLPGFKVLHVQEVDPMSSCPTLVVCLGEIEAWSLAAEDHIPLLVLVEVKDDPIPDPVNLGFVTPHQVRAAELDALDAEIRSVFDDEHLLTPDDVRGDRATLREAVVEDGWPTLAASRGKVMFALDNENDVRDAYLDGHPSLEGRVMFASVDPTDDAAAFVKLNNPIADGDRIRELVGQGFVIRTRADADTEQARSEDTTMRDAALASGAQYVSSDYLEPDERFSNYEVSLPGEAVARCNPVNAPDECDDEELTG